MVLISPIASAILMGRLGSLVGSRMLTSSRWLDDPASSMDSWVVGRGIMVGGNVAMTRKRDGGGGGWPRLVSLQEMLAQPER